MNRIFTGILLFYVFFFMSFWPPRILHNVVNNVLMHVVLVLVFSSIQRRRPPKQNLAQETRSMPSGTRALCRAWPVRVFYAYNDEVNDAKFSNLCVVDTAETDTTVPQTRSTMSSASELRQRAVGATKASASPPGKLQPGKLVPMQRTYVVDGMSLERPPPQGVASSCVACVTLLLFGLVPQLATFYLPIACLITWNPVVIVFTIVLWATALIPAQRHWPAFLNSYVLKTWREYFEFSYIALEELDPEQR